MHVRNLRPESVHVGVDDYEDKGDHKVEDKPDVNHLDISRHRQVRIDLIRYSNIPRRDKDTWTNRATSTSIDVRLMAMTDSK